MLQVLQVALVLQIETFAKLTKIRGQVNKQTSKQTNTSSLLELLVAAKDSENSVRGGELWGIFK